MAKSRRQTRIRADDDEQHAGVYDFNVFTDRSGQTIVGGKIENRKNLMDKDGPVPGEFRSIHSFVQILAATLLVAWRPRA